MLCLRPKRVLLFDLSGDHVGDGRKNENPSGVEVDWDAENFAYT